MNQLYELKSEACIWNDFITGKEESFRFIYNRYVKVLYKYGCQFTCDHDLVRDCVQDLFLDLQEYRTGLIKINDNVRLYLFKSLKNRIVHSILKLKIFKEPDENSSGAIGSNPEDDIIDEETRVQIQARLSSAFSKLSYRQKEALYLKFISGLNYSEIGKVLHLNYQSTRNLIFRGLEKLRECHNSIMIFCFSVSQVLEQILEFLGTSNEV